MRAIGGRAGCRVIAASLADTTGALEGTCRLISGQSIG
jgi:hypothetical protein